MKSRFVEFKPKVIRYDAGVYAVVYKGNIFIIRGGASFNPQWKNMWDVWTARTPNECRDDNCWAMGAKSKAETVKAVVDHVDNLK